MLALSFVVNNKSFLSRMFLKREFHWRFNWNSFDPSLTYKPIAVNCELINSERGNWVKGLIKNPYVQLSALLTFFVIVLSSVHSCI